MRSAPSCILSGMLEPLTAPGQRACVSGCSGRGRSAWRGPGGTGSAPAGRLAYPGKRHRVVPRSALQAVPRGHRKTCRPVSVAGKEGRSLGRVWVWFSGTGAVTFPESGREGRP